MSGLDDIINIINERQKQNENSIIQTAERKSDSIMADGDRKAQTAFEECMKKESEKARTDFINACNSTDADMKRKILKCRVEIIDSITDRVLERLGRLCDEDYFNIILRLAEKKVSKGNGIMYFGKNDMKRITESFEMKLKNLAILKGGTLEIAESSENIENGFILEYGLISENCTFKSIIEAERNDIRDTIAREIFSAGDC
ncbi:MAG: H(+)-transporting ATPase [Ruminococcus sp.]|nr:H(+)-transporting ATPase [Ruminococcus sp.]